MSVENDGQVDGVAEQVTPGADTVASPTTPTKEVSPASPNGGAIPVADTLPFHERPEAKEYLERQARNLRRELEESHRRELDKYRSENDSRYAQLQKQLGSQDNQLTPERRAEIQEAKKLLGLEGLDEMRQELSQFKQNRAQEAFDSEFNSVVEKYASEYGYDKKDLDYELRDFIVNDPLWGNMGNSKGVVAKAARDFFSDKQAELAERRANLKLINEKKSKSASSSQKPVGNGNPQNKVPTSVREVIEKLQSEGVKFGS